MYYTIKDYTKDSKRALREYRWRKFERTRTFTFLAILFYPIYLMSRAQRKEISLIFVSGAAAFISLPVIGV